MSILSKADWAFWEENGYVVIPDAVPKENIDAVIDASWDFLEMDRNDPHDWYRDPLRTNGMVEMYQHQALWDNRQHPNVYGVFSEIWGTEALWVSMDRVNFKLPVRPDQPDFDNKGFIHWDIDVQQEPVPFMVQGVLYLSDTSLNQGGFQCIPGFHKEFHEWVKRQPDDWDPRRPDLSDYEIQSIPGKTGDLLIWHSLLLHGNGHNTSDRIRQAQYITMYPTREDDREAAGKRVGMWQEHQPPDSQAFPGDPRGWESANCEVAELTDLGKKLLGLEKWQA